MALPDESELRALVGHVFPGGHYRIAHWENFLLTDATGSRPLPDGLAHPVHLFHVPIAGVGVSLAELFALGQADDDGAISIDYYDWELDEPLREEIDYFMHGGITEYSRDGGGGGPVRDSLSFEIAFERDANPSREGRTGAAGGEAKRVQVGRVTFRWHYWRFQS